MHKKLSPICKYSIQKTEGKAFQSLPLPQAFLSFFLSTKDDWEAGSWERARCERALVASEGRERREQWEGETVISKLPLFIIS